MAATFNSNLSDAISRVRFALGDTDVAASPELQDDTIQYHLSAPLSLTEKRAAAVLARAIAAKYARYADTTMDDQLTRYSHVYKNWVDLAERLEAIADAEAAAPTPAGVETGYVGIVVNGIGDCRGPLEGDCCAATPYWPYR